MMMMDSQIHCLELEIENYIIYSLTANINICVQYTLKADIRIYN